MRLTTGASLLGKRELRRDWLAGPRDGKILAGKHAGRPDLDVGTSGQAMSEDGWTAIDRDLFVTVLALQNITPADKRYQACKDRFGVLFVKRLGGWLGARFGRSLWMRGIEVEEVLHDVYLRVHARLFAEGELDGLDFESPDKLRNYLFTVARKAAITALAERVDIPLPGPSCAPDGAPALRWIWRHLPFLDPERRSSSAATFEGTAFKEREQEALYLWYVDECPHQQIAQRLQTTPSAAKQLVYRAKLKLLALLPRFAAEECMALLTAIAVERLRQAGAHEDRRQREGSHQMPPANAAPATDAGTLAAVRRLAGVVRLGLEEDRPRCFRTDVRDVLCRKITAALREHVCSAEAVASGLNPLGDTLTEMLIYLTLRTVEKLPRNWSVNEDGARRERGRIAHEDADRLVFLFFCLCAMLPRRPKVRAGLVGSACRILADAWPAPSVPSQDWPDRATAALAELARSLSGAAGEPPPPTPTRRAEAEEGRPTDSSAVSVDPELCWARVLIAEHGAAAMEQLSSESSDSHVADWLWWLARARAERSTDASGRA